jgi:hypothetical protein
MSHSSDDTPSPRQQKLPLPAQSETESVGPAPDTAALEPAVEILRPLLRNPGQAQQVVARVATAVLFRGPLPPPDVFKGYDDIVPGSAREILDMATREQSHRHKLQFLEMIYPYLGWFAGFVCFLVCIAGSVYLAMHDKPVIAAALLGVPCLGVIGWFINSRVSLGTTQPAVAKAAPAKRPPRKRR